MTWSDYFAAQLDRSRNIALSVVKDFDDADFYRKFDRVNPGIWILGHLANSEPGIVYAALGEKPPLPEGWSAWFRLGSKVLDDLHQYPALSEIRRVLDDSHRQTQKRIMSLSDEDLLKPVHPDMAVFAWMKMVRDALGFAAIHECNHGGQLMLLRRLLGKPGLV